MKLTENSALFAGALGLIAALIAAGMTQFSGLLSFSALLPVLFMLVAVSAVVFIRLRLERLAEDEKRDHLLLAKEKPDASIFQGASDGEDPFSIGRSQRQFEKFIVPWVAPLLGLAQLYWAWSLFNQLPWELSDPTNLTLAAALLGGMAFVFFLTSRFLLGLSRHKEGRLLRGPGILAGLVCWGAVVALVGAMAEHAGFERADEWAARGLVAATALLGLENLFHSLLSLYSHRRTSVVTTYESKIGALVVDPGILTKSMTEAMDYQFGFSFSQTWFFKIIQRAVVPLLIVQAVLLYTMSCFVFLAPHESGILERFGKPVADRPLLTSGFHLKKPWPFESIRRVPTGRIMLLKVGFEPHAEGHRPAVITWTVPHYEREDVFLVASRTAQSANLETTDQLGVPVSMITVNIPVEYRITNALAYSYRFQQPDQMLRQMTYQIVTREFARRDLDELFASGRVAINESMRTALQQKADQLDMGVVIEFLGIQGIHPPVQVAAAYQSVVGALEEKEAVLLEARAYTNRVLPLAHAYAQAEQSEAAAYRFRRAVLAEAEGQQFTRRLLAYQASPRTFKHYHYLAMLREATKSSRLYVLDLPAQGSQTLWLNLEEKPFSGVLDMAPLMMEGGH